MSVSNQQNDSSVSAVQDVNDQVKSGTVWTILGFGFGQVLRLFANVVLAAILFEEVFALMAIVGAVLIGLAMFSDIGIQTSVIQNPRGDDPDFLNTAWTLQVIRGACLFVGALALAWPISQLYGANDPKAYELAYLIPIAALTCIVDAFRPAKAMTAARHLRIKELVKIELIVSLFSVIIMLTLAWYMRSVLAIVISSVMASCLTTLLSYWMLKGPRSRFRWEKESVLAVFRFGKWIMLSTLIGFFALQMDRLIFAAVFPLAEVGVYAIAAGLSMLIMTIVGRLQLSIIFPWYSRLLSGGVSLPIAFGKAKFPVLLMSTYLVVLLIVGSSSFFSLFYDERYSQAAILLPILAIAVWLNSIESMYGSAFLAKGYSKWGALTGAVKVVSFLIFLKLLLLVESSLVIAAIALVISEVIRVCVVYYLGSRLGLLNLRIDITMLAILVITSAFGLWLVHSFEPVVNLHPVLQLLLLGIIITLFFTPLFIKILWPILKKESV
jgi:O-antigen/teichoic acid export membrane protein